MDVLYFLRTIAALGTVLGLLVGALWAVRRYNISLPGQTGARTSRRLALVERVGIDARRSIVLVRRDDREHLIMVAPDGQLVIESNIVREEQPAPASQEVAPAAKVQQDFATLVDFVGGAGSKAKAAIAKRAKPRASSEPVEAAAKTGQDFATLVDSAASAVSKAKAGVRKADKAATPATSVAAPKPKRQPVQLKVTAPDGRTLVEPIPAAVAISAAKAA